MDNQNQMNAFQAKLIKLGVDPEGLSFDSSVTGEESRGDARIKALEKERDAKKSTVTSNYLAQKSALQKQEREETFKP